MDKSVQIIMQILSERGIKPGTMMRELGFSSGLFSQWKAGTQMPSRRFSLSPAVCGDVPENSVLLHPRLHPG